MNKAIQQTISFSNTNPRELFDIFTDPEKHSELLGAKVVISAKEGARFSCFDGNVTGRNLLIVPDRMIVQSWKGNVWEQDDLDSILVLTFSETKGGAQIDMVHANTPGQFIEKWNEFYWKPMKQYLKRKS
jgi:activator of HSP90 ATPase